MLGTVQTQKERTTLDAKELNQTKDTDGGTEGKHMASSPTVQLRKGQHFSGDTRQTLVRYWCCPGAADGTLQPALPPVTNRNAAKKIPLRKNTT